MTTITERCRILRVDMKQTVWDRIEQLMKERGENPTSLAKALRLARDTIRQIKIRCEENPEAAGARGSTLASIAEHYDVSMHWLMRGGDSRGQFNPFETGEGRLDVAAIALRIGIRREVVDYVLARNAEISDVWVLFGLMHGLESSVRSGAQKVPELKVSEAGSSPRSSKGPKRK